MSHKLKTFSFKIIFIIELKNYILRMALGLFSKDAPFFIALHKIRSRCEHF